MLEVSCSQVKNKLQFPSRFLTFVNLRKSLVTLFYFSNTQTSANKCVSFRTQVLLSYLVTDTRVSSVIHTPLTVITSPCTYTLVVIVGFSSVHCPILFHKSSGQSFFCHTPVSFVNIFERFASVCATLLLPAACIFRFKTTN